MKVEVEFEDLETLLFATAAIKNIESLLTARKYDPFVKPHLQYNQAHDAVLGAMNQARRATADTATAWDGELTKPEIQFLEDFNPENPAPYEMSGEYRTKHKEIDALAAKGCVRIGQMVSGCIWAGQDRPDLKPIPVFAVAITPRGKEKLEQALSKVAKAKDC